MTQWTRALAAHAEDPGSTPSAHTVAQTSMSPVPRVLMPSSGLVDTRHMCSIHIYLQAKQSYTENKKKKKTLIFLFFLEQPFSVFLLNPKPGIFHKDSDPQDNDTQEDSTPTEVSGLVSHLERPALASTITCLQPSRKWTSASLWLTGYKNTTAYCRGCWEMWFTGFQVLQHQAATDRAASGSSSSGL